MGCGGIDGVSDLYGAVIGQPRAVQALQAAAKSPVHAYLFVGPQGTGKRSAAKAFAAQLLCEEGGCGSCATCAHALAGQHPDLHIVERSGASIRTEALREVVRKAHTSPTEAARKVLLLVDFHLLTDAQYPIILKTLEEPPPTAVLIVTAEHLPEHLVTIASRCVEVGFAPAPDPVIADALVAEGIDRELADRIAVAAAGRIDRARLLASDPGFAARQEAWMSVAHRLDGTGATAAQLVEELLGSVDSVAEPLAARQAQELADLDARVKLTGERGSGRKELTEEHKRQLRRLRTDEIRFGLQTLAAEYRRRLVEAHGGAGDMEAIRLIDDASRALIVNVNEPLLLQALLLRIAKATAGSARARPA